MAPETPAEIMYEGQFIRLLRKGKWEYIERSNCTGIVIIVSMTTDQNVILVEQFRPPVHKSVIEFPAGLLNDRPGFGEESLEEGAKRELLEETGYQAEHIIPLMTGPVSAGSSADSISMVQAINVKKVSNGGGDADESIIVHEVPLADIDKWLENQSNQGLMIEPKIYSGLYFLKSYNR